MSRRSRKPNRGPPARRMSPRALVDLAEDTEKLMSSSIESPEVDPARKHSYSRINVTPESRPASHHDYSMHEISNVPAPIPDTGLPPPSADTTTPITPSVSAPQTSVSSRAFSSHSHATSKSAFVPLPSLKTENLTEIEEAAAHSFSAIRTTPTVQPTVVTAAGSNTHGQGPKQNGSHLSTSAVIALAVCAGLTLFIVIALVKIIKRPHRRRTPTPSLPILHDGTLSDNKMESEGSPIFGGREHSSPTLPARNTKARNTGLWTWTQYSSGIPKPAPTVTVTRSSSQNQLLSVDQATQQNGLGIVDNDTSCVQGQGQGRDPFTGYGNLDTVSKTTSPLPLQPVQNAITRAVSRLSTVSMSLYPNSPGAYSQVGADVGLAIDGVTHQEQNVAVPKYKDRMMASCKRTSMITPGSTKDAAAFRRSQSFAYGGMEPTSPPTASPHKAQLNSGRARIKSTYYTPGSYPRASAAPTNYGKHDQGQEHDATYHEQNRLERADSQRGRELTSVFGLASPVQPSPQPTLYPDDSMSVIGEAKKVTLTTRGPKKSAAKASSHCDSPPGDTAALGSLMMVDFAASKSAASLINIRPSEAARTREGPGGTCGVQVVTGKNSLKKKVEDKPPRVPSPPPLPSLAQMALQHADAEGYADYHSPTYSIYGLYDGDRKSRGLSYGY